jgi:molybdopterin-containing oxidoreductase family iron-sulfur binding subunit
VQINDQLEKDHLDEPGLKELTMNLGKNKVKTLFMLGVNPAQTAPGSIDFAAAIKRAKVSIHAGLFNDESGKLSDWHLPLTHFLEHFSDTKSYDGTVSVIQPLIKPLHGARSALELLAQVGDYKTTKPYDMLGETWSSNSLLSLRKIIHDGVFKKSQYKSVAIPNIDAQKTYIEFNRVIVRTPKKDSLELTVKYCYKLGDGRFANNSWLQELPDPVTKMNWDNSLLMSPKAAKEHGIKSGLQKNAYVADIVKVSTKAHQIELPVFVLPGLADYCIVATMGYGRSAAGQVGNGIGVDVNKLRYSPGGYVTPGVKIERLNKTVKLSTTQEQFAMNGDTVQEQTTLSMQNRKPARDEDVATYQKSPTYAKDGGIPKNLLVKEPGGNKKVPLQMTKAWDYSKGNQWGMSIDLTKCIGCNACVTACQSENNIPVVGKEQVMRGRMMHWIRIDRYFIGDVSSPKSISQPVLCQHCENAPCEPVCPVAATSHDTEGLNVMTYNRCIGTRYCANNCPYKVRRFNYFDFTHSGNLYVDPKTKERQKTLKLQRNPDVTVRYRGVMEKCTFCTQRIQEAKMDARRKGNDPNNLPDGAVTPACAQTCPTEAIVFGNINDKNSKVAGKKRIDRDYSMLDILNTRPRITYLAKLRNPHPELVK